MVCACDVRPGRSAAVRPVWLASFVAARDGDDMDAKEEKEEVLLLLLLLLVMVMVVEEEGSVELDSTRRRG